MKDKTIASLGCFLIFSFQIGIAQSPVPPVPLPPAEEEIFKVVEEMPRFPGCEDSNESSRSKENCAKEKMLAYIYEHCEYPDEAKEAKVEGMAVIQFTIWKDSTIRNIKIKRNPGYGTGEAAARLVESMKSLKPKWRPGHQRGRPVCVQYTLPIKFKLDDTFETRSKKRNTNNDVIHFSDLHESPKFPDCDKIKHKQCTEESLEQFIRENQIYPKEALANNAEGTVEVSFIIERDGTLSQIKAENKLPYGLSEDAVEIFEWMNTEEMRWTPGKQNYTPVRTYYLVKVNYNFDDWNNRN